MIVDLTKIIDSIHFSLIGIFIGFELCVFLSFCRGEYVNPKSQILPISLSSIVNALLQYLRWSIERTERLETLVKLYIMLAILTLIFFCIVVRHNVKALIASDRTYNNDYCVDLAVVNLRTNVYCERGGFISSFSTNPPIAPGAIVINDDFDEPLPDDFWSDDASS